MSDHDFIWIKPAELASRLPTTWVHPRLAIVMLGHPPSANELKRRGKKVASFRDHWRSLPPGIEVGAPCAISTFPGTKHKAIVAFCKGLPEGFRTFASLVETPIGRWHDLQVIDRDLVVAFTIRENRELVVASPSSRFSLAEAYGERVPLSAELQDYLR